MPPREDSQTSAPLPIGAVEYPPPKKHRRWKIALAIFAVIVFLGIWGSPLIYKSLSVIFPDTPTLEDTPLSLSVLHIPEADNAYYDLVRASSVIPELTGVAKETEIKGSDYISNTVQWDRDNISVTTAAFSEALDNFRMAGTKSVYQDPQFEDPKNITPSAVLTPLSPFRKISRVLALHSLLLFKDGKVDESIDEAFVLLKVGKLLEEAPQEPLITYLVGLSIKGLGLDILHTIASDSRTPKDAVLRIANDVNQYRDSGTGLANSFKAEYQMAKYGIMDVVHPDSTYPMVPKNNFLLQPNLTLGYLAEDTLHDIARINVPCNQFASTTIVRRVSVSSSPNWLWVAKVAITPNGLGKLLADARSTSWDGLFQKRCTEENKIVNLQKFSL